MKSKILIFLGMAAAFGLGHFLQKKDPPQPLVNATQTPPPGGENSRAASNAAEAHQRVIQNDGPKVPIPSPTAEEMMAITSGKPLENRSFKDLTPQQAAILKEALTRLQDPSISMEDAMKILELAAANYGPQILEIASAALKHPAEEVRIRALKLLQRNGDPGILAVASEALKDAAPNVRLSALTALEQQRGPGVKELFKQSLKDSHPDVVLGAVNSASNLPPAQAADVLGEAITACAKDPAVYAINCLAAMHNKEAVPALMKGLTSPDEEVKANAEHIFFSLTGELPENPQKWWDENQHTMDDNLAPIIDGQPNEPIPTDFLPPGVNPPPTAAPPKE
jgi:HEAT repeat protein